MVINEERKKKERKWKRKKMSFCGQMNMKHRNSFLLIFIPFLLAPSSHLLSFLFLTLNSFPSKWEEKKKEREKEEEKEEERKMESSLSRIETKQEREKYFSFFLSFPGMNILSAKRGRESEKGRERQRKLERKRKTEKVRREEKRRKRRGKKKLNSILIQTLLNCFFFFLSYFLYFFFFFLLLPFFSFPHPLNHLFVCL